MRKLLKQRGLYLFVVTAAALLSLLFLLSAPLYSCLSKEQQEWSSIKNGGSVENIFDFADKYKDSEFTDLLTQANTIIADYIAGEEDAEILKEFLNKYPEREAALKNRIAEISLMISLSGSNGADDLEKFIAEFENYGADEKFIAEAKEKLKNLYFTAAKDANSTELFESFIAKYENEDPDMAEEARSLIDDINWENALGKNTRKGFLDYIDAGAGKYTGEANKKIEDLDWIDAYEKSTAQANETLLPVLSFMETYPDSEHIPEAVLLIETIRNDSRIYERYAAQRTLDALEEFIANFPGHMDIGTAEARKSIYEGDIYDFAEKGYIQVKAAGKSIQEIALTVKNVTTSKITVHIPIGVYFAANSGNVQNMAVIKEASLKLASLEETTVNVRVACMNIARDIPTGADSFTPQKIADGSPLTTLIKILAENGALYEVAQAAIWYIQDNPGKDALMNTLINQDEEPVVTEEYYNEAVRTAERALTEFAGLGAD